MKNRSNISIQDIEQIINKCDVCNLAMVDSLNMPYVVPMNFGYENKTIYLHGSPKGKKIDILNQNNNVCVSFSADLELKWQNEGVACSYSMKYRSVIANGKVEFIEDPSEKVKALNVIMGNYTERSFKYNDPSIRDVNVFKVVVEKLEGRVYGY
jgi:hypothetical protein